MIHTNPFVFIVGCPRSGTTLLRHLLGAHPQIAITPEAHWIPKWFEKRRGLTPNGQVRKKLIPRLLAHPKFKLFHLTEGDLRRLAPKGQLLSYAAFVSGIFDLYGKQRGKALVGNKTPDAVRNMGTLHALWPSARFVHLIRDGRDVALSLFDWCSVLQKKPGTFATWGQDWASTAALWWELNVRRGRDTAASLEPGLYHEMRYESLVEDSEKECAALCAFLGVPFDSAILRFHENRPAADSGLDPGHGWQPLARGARDWRTQMAPDEVERFEAAAGELLDQLNYQRTFPKLRPRIVAEAIQIRKLLSNESLNVRPYEQEHTC